MGTKFGLLTAQDASDLGYRPALIFVNGVRTINVETVNDIEGWVDVLEFDLFTVDMEAVPTNRIYGDVIYIPAKGDLKV